MSSKVCARCNEVKDLSEFASRSGRSDGKRSECKACRKLEYQNNAEVLRKRSRDWCRANPEKVKKSNWEAARGRSRFFHAQHAAKRRGLVWEITKDQHALDLTKPCHYCDGKLSETGSGYDRIDNDRGYTPENVVPCCGRCNKARGDWFSYEEMLRLAPVLRELQKEREG